MKAVTIGLASHGKFYYLSTDTLLFSYNCQEFCPWIGNFSVQIFTGFNSATRLAHSEDPSTILGATLSVQSQEIWPAIYCACSPYQTNSGGTDIQYVLDSACQQKIQSRYVKRWDASRRKVYNIFGFRKSWWLWMSVYCDELHQLSDDAVGPQEFHS